MDESERFQRIIEIASEAIISVDNGQNICLFNEGAEAIFGYRKAEVLGEPLTILLPERYRVSHPQHVVGFGLEKNSSRKMNERGQISGMRKNGEEFSAIASILRTGTGTSANYTVILHDISSIEAIREQLRSRIKELETSNFDLAREKEALSRTEDLLDKLLRQSHS